MADPAYRAEHQRTRFANDVAIRVLQYRTEHGLTQTAFGRLAASRVGASGFIGYSPSAGRVLVVIAYRTLDGELHGMNAWPASGRDLATYRRVTPNGEET